MKKRNIMLSLTAASIVAVAQAFAHDGEDHAKQMGADAKDVTVKGEIVDMACYVDHGATGDKHTDCAKKCITMGLPVGIKAEDGKTYLLIGEHKPMNAELVQYAAKTITVKGKAVSRDGVNMIENAEIQK
jgi:type 1 fimbria pilin